MIIVRAILMALVRCQSEDLEGGIQPCRSDVVPMNCSFEG